MTIISSILHTAANVRYAFTNVRYTFAKMVIVFEKHLLRYWGLLWGFKRRQARSAIQHVYSHAYWQKQFIVYLQNFNHIRRHTVILCPANAKCCRRLFHHNWGDIAFQLSKVIVAVGYFHRAHIQLVGYGAHSRKHCTSGFLMAKRSLASPPACFSRTLNVVSWQLIWRIGENK